MKDNIDVGFNRLNINNTIIYKSKIDGTIIAMLFTFSPEL